jgi:hypothetical protein
MRPRVDRSEKDGLVISIDDETNTLTFEWDEETHPQWNFLHDLGEDGVTEMLFAHCQQILSEHETKDLHDPEPSS